MAARTISMDELGAAVKEYAARHELTVSSNEKGIRPDESAVYHSDPCARRLPPGAIR